MATPPVGGDAGDSSNNANLAGDGTTANLQTSSPFQSGDGLEDVRQLAGNMQADDGLHEVLLAQAPTDQQADPGNQLAEMITATSTTPGLSLDQLRGMQPELAMEVEKVGKELAQMPPEQRTNTLNLMRDLYRFYDGNPGDNKEYLGALREGKLDPAGPAGVMRKAEELLQLDPQKREAEMRKIKHELRMFYNL